MDHDSIEPRPRRSDRHRTGGASAREPSLGRVGRKPSRHPRRQVGRVVEPAPRMRAQQVRRKRRITAGIVGGIFGLALLLATSALAVWDLPVIGLVVSNVGNMLSAIIVVVIVSGVVVWSVFNWAGLRGTAIAILSLVAIIAVGGRLVAWGMYNDFEKTTQSNLTDSDPAVAAALTPVKEPKEPFTVLLVGDDRRPGETAARADTIIVARIDPEQKLVWLLSIPRDTRAEIPDHGVNKINASAFYGGPSLTIETVEGFLGIEINHYMSVNFAGFQGVVDALGGVWIDVDVEIDDRKAASHTSNPDARHIEPGYQLLNGEKALTFVRSRDFPDADFTRMRHQQQFFKALADQALKLDKVLKIDDVMKAVAKNMATSMSLSQIIDVASTLKDMGSGRVYTATVLGEWRSPYVWPDETLKEDLVSRMMEGRPFVDPVSEDAADVDPASVTVTVRNGAGIEGVAGNAADILRAARFAVGEVGNANQFVYDRTLIVYKDNDAEAEAVRSALPVGDLVPSRGMYEFTTDILVVVGKDWQMVATGTNATP
jgi:LCP family protein required for cell wall assembly